MELRQLEHVKSDPSEFKHTPSVSRSERPVKIFLHVLKEFQLQVNPMRQKTKQILSLYIKLY